jgi:hypothetical protein
LAALFFCAVKCLWNGGRHDRLKQLNGTKGTTEERPLDCACLYNVNVDLNYFYYDLFEVKRYSENNIEFENQQNVTLINLSYFI